MMTVTYPIHKGIYVNLTNRCPCACTFCLRQNGDSVHGSDSLWLEREPTFEEVCQSLSQWDLTQFDEVVFCGYGEPMERMDVLLQAAAWLRERSKISIRINTNGLADLIWGEPTAPKLAGLIDTVSVSLNATNAEDYLKTVRPRFGIGAYDAMLAFTRECTKYVPNVVMTVVDVVTSPQEQARCREICKELGATLRVRAYEA